MKIEEIEAIAKNCQYINTKTWDDNCYINASLHIVLENEILRKTVHILLANFPPMRVVYKQILKTYISDMSRLNNQHAEMAL